MAVCAADPFPSHPCQVWGASLHLPLLQLCFVSGKQRTLPFIFYPEHTSLKKAKKCLIFQEEMGMSTSAWCSQGPCLMPTLRQLWGGQLGMWWLSASKPSQEGCDTFHHEKDPHWQHTRCWWWGALHHTPHAAASHAQNLFWGQGTHSHPLSHRKRDWSGKKLCKKGNFGCRIWGLEGLVLSAAAWRAGSASCSTRGGDGSCRYVEGRTSTKGCVVLSAGKGKGKAWESCKPGW